MKLLALLAGTIVLAFGQVNPQQCVANAAVPPNLRVEGLTELIGDIVLNCTGGTPTPAGQLIPRGNISVTLNTSVTSRILSNSGSEALLFIDEPQSPTNPQTQFNLCLDLKGCDVVATGGLKEGELVIVEGIQKVHPGQVVDASILPGN